MESSLAVVRRRRRRCNSKVPVVEDWCRKGVPLVEYWSGKGVTVHLVHSLAASKAVILMCVKCIFYSSTIAVAIVYLYIM